jgi:hypothetical protein
MNMPNDARHDRRQRAARTAGKVLVVIALIAVAFLVPLPNVDLPFRLALPDLPDLPGWLRFLLGPGKLIVLAVIILLIGLEETERHRRQRNGTGSGDGKAAGKGDKGDA